MTKKIKCPVCGAETKLKGNPYRPFCSERCKTTDLGAWADEEYSIPGEDIDMDAEEMKEEIKGKKTYH